MCKAKCHSLALKLAPLVLGIIILMSPVTATSSHTDAEIFVQTLANRAFSQLTGKKVSDEERQKKFRSMLKDHFDVKRIGRWALGRYWRKATKDERIEYLKLFENLIVKTYSNRFKVYAGEKLLVSGSTPRKSSVLVNSLFKTDSNKPIRIDWRLINSGHKFKVFDISVEGVSMIQTQRSTFSSVIRRNNGKISGLLEVLKEKK